MTETRFKLVNIKKLLAHIPEKACNFSIDPAHYYQESSFFILVLHFSVLTLFVGRSTIALAKPEVQNLMSISLESQ